MARAHLILDRYRPLAEAGSGGFGTVQVAWDTRIQRKVAIKCIQLSEVDAARIAQPARQAARTRDAAGAPSPQDEHAAPTELLSHRDADTHAIDAETTISLGGIEGAAAGFAPHDAEGAGSATALLEGRNGFVHPATALPSVPGLDEARTAALLTDANIVAVYDFEVQGRYAYLIMEYVDGLTLTQLLERHGAELTLDAVAAVFSGVAHALEVAHENQVLHLDIKPDNILIDRKGQVKVTDFGLAKLAGSGGFGAAGGGTVGYMPLEQMRGASLDARCDEWALASVAYEMLTGENPFLADTLAQAEAAIEGAELVLPSLCWDDLDEQADDVLFYALDPDREERYESVSDFAEELEKFLGDAKRGRRQLAKLANGADDGAEDEGGAAEPARRGSIAPRERIPLAQRIGDVPRAIAARFAAAAGAAAVTALGLANLPGVSGVDNPLFWGILVVVAALAAVLPHAGSLAAYAVLSAALVAQQAPAAGVALAAAAALWWWFVGRGGIAPANVTFAVPLAGAFGGNALAPLAAGGALRPLPALATTLFSVLTAAVLASFGTGNLLGWDALANWNFAGVDVQGALLALIQRPETWCMAAGWLAAAGALSLFRLRRTRAFAFVGVAVATALLIAAACATAWLASGGATAAPSPAAFASIVGAALATACAVALSPDETGGDSGSEEP